MIILAIAYFLQAGKENSQKQVLAYFERTAIGELDSAFYLRPQRKIGSPDCSRCQFFKIFGFWESSLPALENSGLLAIFPKQNYVMKQGI